MKLTFWNLIKSGSGFSLPEIMVGGAILAGVALAGATLFKNQLKAQAVIEQDQMLQQYHRALAKLLEEDHNCNATFKVFYGSASIAAGAGLPAVEICKTDTATCNTNFNANTVVTGLYRFARSGEWIDRDGLTPSKQIWQFNGITFGNTLTKSGAMVLKVNYSLNPKIGTRTVVKDIVVNLRFNSDATPDPISGIVPVTGFIKCFNNQESSVNNLQNDICKSLFTNFSSVTSNGVLTYWDEASQSCKLNGTTTAPLKDCTAQGMMVEGIRSDGTVHCRNISQGFDAAASVDTAACSASTNVKLVWDGTRLKVTCVP